MNTDQVRNFLTNKQDLNNVVEPLVDEYFKSYELKDDLDYEVKQIIIYQSNSILKNNIDIVEKTHESEIERLFLNSLNISSLLCGLEYLVTFTHPPHFSVSTLEFIEAFRRRHQDIEYMYKSYKEHFPEKGPKDFEVFVEESGEFSESDLMTIKTHMILYRGFMSNAFHMVPQASFPELKLNNKGIRVDEECGEECGTSINK